MSLTMKIGAVLLLLTLVFFYFVHASGTIEKVQLSKKGVATEYEDTRMEWHWDRFFPYFQEKGGAIWTKVRRGFSRFKKKMSNLSGE